MTTAKKPEKVNSGSENTNHTPVVKEEGKMTSKVQNTHEAFPFKTENPSGVPGATEISEGVVAAIVGHACENIEGVVALGTTGLLRAVVGAVSGESASRTRAKAKGIAVESGAKEAIFDIRLTVEYGHSIPKVVEALREAAATELHEQVGLVAKEVNVLVVGIEFPDHAPTPRVK